VTKQQNPLAPFNTLVRAHIETEKVFFQLPDGTYDKDGIRASLHQTFAPLGQWSGMIFDAYLASRLDYYFRSTKAKAAPPHLRGMRTHIQIPLPGYDEFFVKELVDCLYGDVADYVDYMLAQRSHVDRRVTFGQEIMLRMQAAGAVQRTEPIRPYLTDDELQALS
jgi:hypothetical protein